MGRDFNSGNIFQFVDWIAYPETTFWYEPNVTGNRQFLQVWILGLWRLARSITPITS